LNFLSAGQDVAVLIKGAVLKEETEDHQDGSVNITYVVKPTMVEFPKHSESVPEIEPIELPEEREIDIASIPF